MSQCQYLANPGRIPIVVMTASASRRNTQRHRMPDMDDYLGKPLQLAGLRAALDAWLPAVEAGEL